MPLGPYKNWNECLAAQMDIYRKKHPNWTEEHLREVAGGVCYKIEQQINQGVKAIYTYGAKLHSPEEHNGERYAKIRVIDTNVSGPTPPIGERWKVSYFGLREALDSLMKAPLIGPPEEGHQSKRVVGRPIQFMMPDGYVDVLYKITDDEAWRAIINGQYDVSPQVTADDSTPSFDSQGPFQLLNKFQFEHVAQVDEGAFKSAEVQDICEGGKECIYRLSAELFHGHRDMTNDVVSPSEGTQTTDKTTTFGIGETKMSETYSGANAWDTVDAPDKFFAYVPAGPKSERKLPLASVEKKDYDVAIVRNALARFKQTHLPDNVKASVLSKICRVASQLGIDSDLCKERQGELTMSEEEKTTAKPEPCADRVKILEDQLKTVIAENEKKTQRIEQLERAEPYRTLQAQLDEVRAENKELKEWRASTIDTQQLEKAKDVADYRIQAGFCDERDRITEIERLKKFDESALKLARDDAITALTEMSSGPKARFKARASSTSDDVHIRMRERLGL